ncbi:MAG: hypothetical protein Kow00117_19770 [Phototrophicales bacterium]
MAMIKPDNHNAVVPLSPAAKNVIVAAVSSGALWIVQRMVRYLLRRGASVVQIKPQNRPSTDHTKKWLTVHIGRRVYHRLPSGQMIESGEEYIIHFDGDTPDDLSITLGGTN